MVGVERRRVIVRGRVQGVGYRYSMRIRAQELGISGWVRNRTDGTVEAEIEGSPDAVALMLAWMTRGPAGAEVVGIESGEAPAGGASGFEIRRTG